jgi:hypothetical protein
MQAPLVRNRIFAALLAAAPLSLAADTPSPWPAALETFNIVWDSPSTGSADSMPLAGHNLGLNVWVENNDVLALIGSPDALDENGMQVKLGLIRLHFDAPVLAAGFRQELRLAQSEIVIQGDDARVTLWGEAGRTVAHARIESQQPLGVSVSYETWIAYEAKVAAGGIQWMRRLPEDNARRLRDLKAQGLIEAAALAPDPLSRLTLGGRLDAPGLAAAEAPPGRFNGMATKVCAMRTAAPVRQLDLTLTLRMEQDHDPAGWETALQAAASAAAAGREAARARARAWWKDFWHRSHISIRRADGVAASADKPWLATRNYQLVRYLLAANPSGRAMTLFNGGLFPCTGNPDQRNWDGCQFMAQNQMLVYWPLQRSGDFDLLKVGCDFYRDRTPLRREHAKRFWGVDGVTYPEPLSLFGLDAIGTTADGRSSPNHLNYHYTSGMVFALMMLGHDSYAGTRTPGYADAALGIVRYYDQYYQRKLEKETGRLLDDAGKLVIYPSDACEPYHGCVNNLDVLAGLRALTRDLLDTPPGVLDAPQRAYLEGFGKRIPDYKFEEKEGRKLYAAADKPPEWIFHNKNMDFPQMYICFPFNAVSLGRSDMESVRNTWELGPVNAQVQHQNQCWYQNSINLARMGDTMMAARLTLEKLLHPGLRFPAFFYTHYIGGGSFCHPPDTDHGGVAMTALQEMLMQTDGRRILLGPAWPREWTCDFKLRAPYATTVEGRVDGGKVVVDRVTPETRRADIEIFPLRTGVMPRALSQGGTASASSNYNVAGYEPARAVDGDLSTRWASSMEARAGWLAVDLGAETEVGRVWLSEIEWPETREFVVEVKRGDEWVGVARGTTIGRDKTLTFPPVRTREVRLRVLRSERPININEFQVFGPE